MEPAQVAQAMQPAHKHELGKLASITARVFPSIRTLHTRYPITVSTPEPEGTRSWHRTPGLRAGGGREADDGEGNQCDESRQNHIYLLWITKGKNAAPLSPCPRQRRRVTPAPSRRGWGLWSVQVKRRLSHENRSSDCVRLGPVYIHLVQRIVATRLMMAAKHLSVFS
jgi:hypothetical protein